MSTRPIIGISNERVKFDIVESNEVDGKHILSKVRGVFFVPDGKSRNGRFYPKELWENVVNDPEVKQRLKSKAVYGTVGHSQKIDDDAVLNGLVSHIVTSMEIKGGKGIGEALILNTPAGRNLNTILQAGGSMFVSTRADGTFEGKHEGLPVVSPKTYNFDTVDFVLDAGFIEANPSLVESYNELVKCNNKNKEGNTMSEKLIEMLSNSNADLKVEVKTLGADIESLKEAKSTLEEENKHLTSEMEKFEEASKKMKEMEDEIEAKEKEKKELEEKLASYEKLGESAEDVESTLTNALAHIKKVNEELGGFDNAKSALETAIAFKKQVDEAGGLDSLLEAKKKMKEMEDEAEAEKKEKEAKELAEELGISEAKVKELLESHDVEGIRKMYQALEENLDKDKYRKVFESKKGKKSESDDEDEDDDMDDEDDISESMILSKGRVNSIRV